MGIVLLLGFTYYIGAWPVRKSRILVADRARSIATSGTTRALSSMSRPRNGGSDGNTASAPRASDSSTPKSTGDSNEPGDSGGGTLFAHHSSTSTLGGGGGEGDVNNGGDESPCAASVALSLSRRVWKDGPGDLADVEQVPHGRRSYHISCFGLLYRLQVYPTTRDSRLIDMYSS